jgi:putative aldouronate transport system permease protein
MAVGIRYVSKGDKVFDVVNYIILTFALLVTLYPLYFVVIASFSDFRYVNNGEVWLWPKGFSLAGYTKIFENAKVWTGYQNSIMYTVVGTAVNVVLTLLSGYALSRKDFYGRNVIMYVMTFTMLFHGGLIPSYLVIKQLGLIDNFWVMILPGAIGAYQVIVTRTFFQTTIPDELLESAQIDGCTNTRFFLSIVLPLSSAIIAVITMFYAVGHWNAFFNAFIYLRDSRKYPLQLILRDILLENQAKEMFNIDTAAGSVSQDEVQNLSDLIKYGIIIVSSLPVLALYPFLQKYFVKGVMIGAIKG